MRTPATLLKLLESAQSKVEYLQNRLEHVRRKAVRTGSMADECEASIVEAQLEQARSHLNSLKMQARYESRFTDLVT